MVGGRGIEPLTPSMSRERSSQKLNKISRCSFSCRNKQIDGIPVKEWLEMRTEAALKIDPETALILRSHVCPSSPYGTYSKIPEHCEEIFDDYYARSPGSDVWVYAGDLPKEVARALEKRHKINTRLVSYNY